MKSVLGSIILLILVAAGFYFWYQWNVTNQPESCEVEVHYNRGIEETKLGQYEDALANFNTAIELNPDFADAYYNRGEIKMKLYQYDAALTDFNTAIQLNPEHAKAYHNRGLTKALLRLRQTWKAKQDFQTALQDFQTALKLAIQGGDVELKNHIEETLRLL